MGASATTNYNGCGLLYVFSSSAPPFEEGTAYTKFHAYTLLEHGGDFRQAALALSNLGYGASQLGTLRGPADSLRRYASYERLSLGSGGIHDHGGVE